MVESVTIASCPQHGLHGMRTECFTCGGPVEQIEMVPVAELRAHLAAHGQPGYDGMPLLDRLEDLRLTIELVGLSESTLVFVDDASRGQVEASAVSTLAEAARVLRAHEEESAS